MGERCQTGMREAAQKCGSRHKQAGREPSRLQRRLRLVGGSPGMAEWGGVGELPEKCAGAAALASDRNKAEGMYLRTYASCLPPT